LIPFPQDKKTSSNIIPYNGVAQYYGKLYSAQQATELYSKLFDGVPWENDVLYMFGKRIVTQRKVAWFGDRPFDYNYSKQSKKALPWTKELFTIKEKIEFESQESYNSCLLNLYHQGEEGMGWHSDNEKELKKHAAIASISFGAERKFVFKHRETKEKCSLLLEHGSMLLMKGEIQDFWLHSLPKTKKITTPRINS